MSLNYVSKEGLSYFYSKIKDFLSGKADLSGATFTGAINIGTNNLNMQNSYINGSTGNGLRFIHNNKPITLYDNMLYSMNPSTSQLGTTARPWGTINATNIKENGVDLSAKYLTEHQSLDDYALKSEVPTDNHINDLINTALGVIENGTY